MDIHSMPKLRKMLFLAAAAVLLFGLIFFFIGMDKKNNYEPPTGSYSIRGGKHAYVNGDAYNLLINGTYYAGYMVLAAGCLVSSTVLAVGGILAPVPQTPAPAPPVTFGEGFPPVGSKPSQNP